jgi:hypothetical protein
MPIITECDDCGRRGAACSLSRYETPAGEERVRITAPDVSWLTAEGGRLEVVCPRCQREREEQPALPRPSKGGLP